MAYIRRNSSLTDVISVLFYKNLPKRQYLLVDCNEMYTIPCSRSVEDNWSETADYVQTYIFGKIETKDIIKILKVWVPNFPRRHAYHVIYSVEISDNCELKAKTYSKWLTLEEMQIMPNKMKLCTPEIVTFVMINEIFRSGKAAIDFENTTDVWADNNVLTEISEKVALVFPVESIPDKYIELLKSADIEISDQRCLYTDFLVNCFPYLYMNLYTFIHVLVEIMKWEKEDSISLFRSADLYNRGALSFHDFLFIFAACSKTTSHTGQPAEIRSKYIFRFFDDNADGLMSYENYLRLIRSIRSGKRLSVDNGSVIQEAVKSAANIGISPDISMTLLQFISAVGELKLRGTSTLLRFTKTIKEYLFNIGMSPQIKPSPTSYQDVKSSEENENVIEEAEIHPISIKEEQFGISTHTLKIKNYGAFIDIDETWSQHDWVSPSSSQLLKSLKDKSSIERFNQASAPNEIINFLKYFSQPSVTDGKLKMSWGTFDMRKFGVCLILLANNLISIMESEPRLLEIPSPVYVMGDLHGNFDNLMHFEEVLWPLSPTLSPSNLLFLGDYVDRGPNGLEVVAYLFSYKLHNPNKVYLLRGNHEVRDIQKSFSFYKECIDKLGPQIGLDVWTSINNVFDVMPLAARIDQRVFCCHGGIPPPSICPTLSSINEIPRRLPLPYDQSQLAWNLMWNDPLVSETTQQIKIELASKEGFIPNNRRGTASLFSVEALNLFLMKHELSHVIRAHEYQLTGASIQFNGKLLTVFSTSDYCGGRNDSACILLARKKICVFRMVSRST